MIWFQKIYGLHALNHQVIEKSWDVMLVTNWLMEIGKKSSILFEQNPQYYDPPILWSHLHSIVALKIWRTPQNRQTHSSWMIFVFSFFPHLVLSHPSQNGSCLRTQRPLSRCWGGHQIRRESHSWLTVWGFKIWVFCFTRKGKTRQTFGKLQLNTNKSNWI